MQVMREGREVIRINAPEWFALDAFQAALDRCTAPTATAKLATFHRHGAAPTESSDVFVLFEARNEPMPDGTHQWIVESSDLLAEPGLEPVYEGVVRLTSDLGLTKGLLWLTNVGSLLDDSRDRVPDSSDRSAE